MISNSSHNQAKLPAEASILAGGKSQRMGRDKAWLELGGEPLVARLLRMLAPQFETVRIIANDVARFEPFGTPVHADIKPGSGPLGGIHTALSKANRETVFVIGCDYPFINPHFINGLEDLLQDHDALVPRQNQVSVPVCAFYSIGCLSTIEASLNRGILEARAFLSEVDVRWVEDEELKKLDPSGLALTNLNTPDDYRKALTLLEKASLF